MIVRRCETGGPCTAKARWVITDAATRERRAACPAHVRDAADELRDLGATVLLAVIVGPKVVPRCDWLDQTGTWPFLRRCPRPAVASEPTETGAVVRACADHHRGEAMTA